MPGAFRQLNLDTITVCVGMFIVERILLLSFGEPGVSFAGNSAGRFGNFGRNVFSGPASASTNLAIVKSFPISERLGRVQFRSEFFNLWNSVNFGSPVLLLNNRNFGRIQTAGDPRIVQLALRYAF